MTHTHNTRFFVEFYKILSWLLMMVEYLDNGDKTRYELYNWYFCALKQLFIYFLFNISNKLIYFGSSTLVLKYFNFFKECCSGLSQSTSDGSYWWAIDMGAVHIIESVIVTNGDMSVSKYKHRVYYIHVLSVITIESTSFY